MKSSERIEGVLCKKLKWRHGLQEELEKLRALEELDSHKRWGDAAPAGRDCPYRYHHCLSKPCCSRWSASPDSAMLHRGSQTRTGAKWRPASSRLSARYDSAHKPLLDALGSSKYQ